MNRRFVIIGGLSGAMAVAAGAFGAHALRSRLEPALLDAFETGARYQMYHALALVAAAGLESRWAGRLTRASAWLFVSGTVLFCGSLYAMALTGARSLGAITPIGGGCFIAGWLCLVAAAARAPRSLAA